MVKPKRNIRTRVKPRTTKSTTSKTVGKKRTRRASTSSTRKSAGYDTGAVGFEKAENKRERQEEEYQKRLNTPFDFRLKPGTEGEVIVLDDEPPFFINLHKVKNAKGHYEDEVCIMDTGERCPLCEREGKEGAYNMVLTVLDTRPYKKRDGKTVKVSKKLFKVKGRNLPKFKRQYERLKGNWRGLRILCARGHVNTEAAIGEDLQFLGKVSEAKLAKFKDVAKPVDYLEIFPIPTAKELRKRYGEAGTGSVVGSDEFSGDDDDYDLDSVGWDDEDK